MGRARSLMIEVVGMGGIKARMTMPLAQIRWLSIWMVMAWKRWRVEVLILIMVEMASRS